VSRPEFRVARTRKGEYPIFLERRAAGKTVTIVRNLSGDTNALLALLKRHCAAGGKAFADCVEIQGDHRSKVNSFLREKGF
jgi:translation initiation factor 1